MIQGLEGPGERLQNKTGRRMNVVYNILLTVGVVFTLPLILPLSWATGKRRKTVLQRLGLKDLPPRLHGNEPRPIWVHALSVGEVVSAVPLVKAMGRRFGGRAIVFSASTLTGFTIARDRLGGQVASIFYYPYDFLFTVKRIARAVDPALVVLVESDVWPNFLFQMRRRHVPTLLVNARLSRSSFKGYRAFSRFFVPMFSTLTRICAQSETDARRFRRLGIGSAGITVTGNLKFDRHRKGVRHRELERLTTALQLDAVGPVIVAGSTHDGEESMLLAAFSRVRRRMADAFLVIAPRNPDRAGAVDRLCREAGFRTGVLRGVDRAMAGSRPDVCIVATMGVLNTLYNLADVAFVGGSLVEQGGHNPLEPAACAKPVLFGEDMSDFLEIAHMLVAAGGAFRVRDARTLADRLIELLESPTGRRQAGANALAVVTANSGAVERTIKEIERCLK